MCRDYRVDAPELRVAWSDGVVTEEEREDLIAVALLLEVPVEIVLDAVAQPIDVDVVAEPTRFTLSPGDVVVLTGEMSRARSEWEQRLREQGMIPKPAVTKAARLVIAADPDSLSGRRGKLATTASPSWGRRGSPSRTTEINPG